MVNKPVMELRWDPTLREWVLVSNIRRFRPWQPSNYCPFCPGNPETGYGWRALILENRYPMLMEDPPEPSNHWFYRTGRSVVGATWLLKPLSTTLMTLVIYPLIKLSTY
ncbi:hypothetical protein [Vulcanisaeta sp. JCM 14467]|uniref:hypothetical protein n=1 Tax=Vulcanisaeta sp. JCM 14467 TaxID=1295370 RepID=UPI000AE1E0ED